MYERITNGLAGTRKEEKEKEKGERLGCWDTYLCYTTVSARKYAATVYGSWNSPLFFFLFFFSTFSFEVNSFFAHQRLPFLFPSRLQEVQAD